MTVIVTGLELPSKVFTKQGSSYRSTSESTHPTTHLLKAPNLQLSVLLGLDQAYRYERAVGEVEVKRRKTKINIRQ